MCHDCKFGKTANNHKICVKFWKAADTDKKADLLKKMAKFRKHFFSKNYIFNKNKRELISA